MPCDVIRPYFSSSEQALRVCRILNSRYNTVVAKVTADRVSLLVKGIGNSRTGIPSDVKIFLQEAGAHYL